MVYSDQNNATSNTLDFNGNAFRIKVDTTGDGLITDEDDFTITDEVINARFLEESYANGSFTVLTSVD